MEAHLTQIWIVAGGVLLCGLGAVTCLVRGDLKPMRASGQGLGRHGRLALGAVLGIGVIAFTIKLIALFFLSSYPTQTISPILAQSQMGQEKAQEKAARLQARMVQVPKAWTLWEALPETAPAPIENPTTKSKIALGKQLFHDKNLSQDRSLSCASCHDIDQYGGADGKKQAIGVQGAVGHRNTPTVLNAAFQRRLFWDGRASSLEQQALGPLLNPIEMGMPSDEAVVARVIQEASYPPAFRQAFGADGKITIKTITQALAAYQRSLITPDSPYDDFIKGDATALSEAAQRGMFLFADLGCKLCHAGPNFSGASLIGPKRPYAPLQSHRLAEKEAQALSQDKGRAGPESDLGVWRIPSLRNVALTAPYFHNGSVDTLSEAVRIMAQAQLNAKIIEEQQFEPESDMKILRWSQEDRSFTLTQKKILQQKDVSDLVAFLEALTSRSLQPK